MVGESSRLGDCTVLSAAERERLSSKQKPSAGKPRGVNKTDKRKAAKAEAALHKEERQKLSSNNAELKKRRVEDIAVLGGHPNKL
jgi:hypothetical protein